MDAGTRTCMRLRMRLTAVRSRVARARSKRPDLPPLRRGVESGLPRPPETTYEIGRTSAELISATAAGHPSKPVPDCLGIVYAVAAVIYLCLLSQHDSGWPNVLL